MNTGTEIKNPAGGPGFGEGCGGDANPQAKLEAFSLDCQGNYNSVHILAGVLDKYLELRSEVILLRAENVRLRKLARGGA